MNVPNFVDLLSKARAHVEASPLYKRFIAHTPLENDIACWMAAFASEALHAAIDSWEPAPAPAVERPDLLDEVHAMILRRAIPGHAMGMAIIDGLLRDLQALRLRRPSQTPETPRTCAKCGHGPGFHLNGGPLFSGKDLGACDHDHCHCDWWEEPSPPAQENPT